MEEKKEVIAPPEPLSIIDKADAIAKRLEEANKKSEELLAKNENIMAKIMLSGRADAGQTKQEEISSQDYARKLINGELKLI